MYVVTTDSNNIIISVQLPIYKEKGDPMECGPYRGIKLLEHAMKVVENREFGSRLI